MKSAVAIAVVAGSLASSSVMAADMALKVQGSAPSCDPYANYSWMAVGERVWPSDVVGKTERGQRQFGVIRFLSS